MADPNNTELDFTPGEHQKMNQTLKEAGVDPDKLTGKPIVPPFTLEQGTPPVEEQPTSAQRFRKVAQSEPDHNRVGPKL